MRVTRFARRALPMTFVALATLAAGCGGVDDGLRDASRDTTDTTDERDDSADTTDEQSESADDTTESTDDTTDSTDTIDESSDTAEASDDPTRDGETGDIAWEACDFDDSLDCGTMEVPLDYDDPSAGTITLALRRSRATDESERIGPLLINPGGPGVSTLEEQFVEIMPIVLDESVVASFDIVGWDPRGVGLSDHIDCVDDLDPYIGALDPTPDTPEEQAIYDTTAQDFVAQCEANSGDLLPYISTQNTARDMDEIRKALGEDQISYFGFSYGSELGATFATMFPDSVRALVVDGATNPTADYATVSKEQIVGIERALDAVLADCAGDSSCAIYNDGDPGGAYDALFESLEASPLPSSDGRPPIGQGIMAWATISSLYNEEQWADLTDALAEAQDGDGDGMLALYDQYWNRSSDGEWNDSYEALIAINCIDEPEPLTDEELATLAEEMAQIAPRTGRWWPGQDTCKFWPTHEDPLEITNTGTGPLLVLGNAGDPVTPIESTQAMAAAIDGVLVTYEGTDHTAYIEAFLAGDSCVIDAVTTYLIEVEPPDGDITCG